MFKNVLINYDSIRVIIMLLSICFFVIILKKNIIDYNKKNSLLISIFILLIIFNIIWFLPFENIFIRFKNIDSIFKYYYNNKSIIKKYEYKNSVYILTSNNNSLKPNELVYFYKDNYWKVNNLWNKGQGTFYNNNGNCSMLIIDNKYDNSFAIMGVYEDFDNIGLSINDSLESKIHIYPYNSNLFSKNDLKVTELKYGKKSKEYKEMYRYYNQKDYIFIIINDSDKIKSNYTIYINNIKCIPPLKTLEK